MKNLLTSHRSYVVQIFGILIALIPTDLPGADVPELAVSTQLTSDLCLGGGLRIASVAGLDTHVIDGHFTGDYSNYLDSKMEDIIFDHQFFAKTRRRGFESMFYVGCGAGKINAEGRSAILDLSKHFRRPTYGFNQIIVLNDKVDHLRHVNGPNKQRRIFNQSISIHLSDHVGPTEAMKFRRSEPNLELFQVAYPFGRQYNINHPFDHFPRARRVYVNSSYGLTHWYNRNPNAIDPLERFAGSFTLIRKWNDLPGPKPSSAEVRSVVAPMSTTTDLQPAQFSVGRVDAIEGALGALGTAIDIYGSRVSELAVRHDHADLLGAGTMLQWSGQLLMGQRHPYSDTGLPPLQDMFAASFAVSPESNLARSILIPGRVSDDLIAELHGGPSQAELNARFGYHPGWCPTTCRAGAACPNGYSPSWIGRQLGWTAQPGGPYDRRVNCR